MALQNEKGTAPAYVVGEKKRNYGTSEIKQIIFIVCFI